MAQRNQSNPRRVEADGEVYQAIQSFVQNPRFASGAIETEHDGLGQIRLVKVVVATDLGIDPALDTLFVKDPDCDGPCRELKAFFKMLSRDFSIS